MHDLMKALIDGKKDVKSLPKSVCAKLSDFFECLKDIPILDVLKLIDDKKAQKILATLDKIVSLANLSQSMGNYFARDDSLDPALCVVCEGLRASTDFEDMLKLRGGTFQSLASAYHHQKQRQIGTRPVGPTREGVGDTGQPTRVRKWGGSASIFKETADAQSGTVRTFTDVQNAIGQTTELGSVGRLVGCSKHLPA